MYCNTMLRSVLALALLANMGAAIPVSTGEEVSDISIPKAIPKASTTKPETPSAGGSASGSGGKILGGVGAASGLVGSVAGLGNLVNGIFHDPTTTPATSCGFFHKLINDCPAPAATPSPAAAPAARSVEEREPALGGLLGGPAQDSTCGFFHRLIHDCPQGNPAGATPTPSPSAIDTMPADPISPPDAALPTTTAAPQRRQFNA